MELTYSIPGLWLQNLWLKRKIQNYALYFILELNKYTKGQGLEGKEGRPAPVLEMNLERLLVRGIWVRAKSLTFFYNNTLRLKKCLQFFLFSILNGDVIQTEEPLLTYTGLEKAEIDGDVISKFNWWFCFRSTSQPQLFSEMEA